MYRADLSTSATTVGLVMWYLIATEGSPGASMELASGLNNKVSSISGIHRIAPYCSREEGISTNDSRHLPFLPHRPVVWVPRILRPQAIVQRDLLQVGLVALVKGTSCCFLLCRFLDIDVSALGIDVRSGIQGLSGDLRFLLLEGIMRIPRPLPERLE
jgi:hypothetical protein